MEKQTLPNATVILIFGILSILGCCCYGVLGIIFAIVGIVLAKKATVLYNESPELYEGYNNVKIGKILDPFPSLSSVPRCTSFSAMQHNQ